MSAEIQAYTEVDLQKGIICAYLEREVADNWLPAKKRDERANGASAQAIAERMKSMKMIDAMLDELIEVPGVRQETYGVGWPE